LPLGTVSDAQITRIESFCSMTKTAYPLSDSALEATNSEGESCRFARVTALLLGDPDAESIAETCTGVAQER
jgi:hypothetical protein